MSNITVEELEKLLASESEDDWNAACDEIKARRGGQYPDDWFASVMASGLMGRVCRRFKS